MMPSFMLTVVGASLAPALIEQILRALGDVQALVQHAQWLAPGRAWRAEVARLEHDIARELLGALLAGSDVDMLITSSASPRKKLLLSDMDSTLITVECIDEIADYAGLKPQVAAITERAMQGEMDFAEALHARVALLSGLEANLLERVYTERVRFMPGAATLVATMRTQGAYAVVVSGGFDFFTSRVAAHLGCDAHVANRLDIIDGKLTGRILPPLVDKTTKATLLGTLCAERGLAAHETLAVGDGANDIPMLLRAGLGVAYRAKPLVQQAVANAVNHGDLTALLYAQGYSEKEFVQL